MRSGRADVIVQPHAQLVFIAARDKDLKEVGTLSAGWPDHSDVAIATRKGSGLANALTIATNALIADGAYAKILDRRQLSGEALPKSETNPPGLPKYRGFDDERGVRLDSPECLPDALHWISAAWLRKHAVSSACCQHLVERKRTIQISADHGRGWST